MTLPEPPKICRYCGAPILWGLKPNGNGGWHRPLDAMSGRPSYMVFGNSVYYGLSYEPHICTEADIKAWDMKYERMAERQYPNRNETVAPPEIKPIREVSPTTREKYRKPKVNKKGKPQETVVVSEFERQSKLYHDSMGEVLREEIFNLTVNGHDRLQAVPEDIGHDSYRQRRDANRWMHALKVQCPKCEKAEQELCVSMMRYHLGQDIAVMRPHDERIKLADEQFGPMYEEN